MAATPTQAPPTVTREPPPRRSWIPLGVAAALLVLVAAAGGWWIGLSSDDPTDAASELPEVLQRYYDAWMDGDSVALAALFTDSGVAVGPQEGNVREPLDGSSTISTWIGIWFGYVDYTDIDVTDVITIDNTVVVVSRVSGDSSTHARGPGGDKTPFSAPAVDVFELDGDLIARVDAYFEYDEVVN